MPTGAPSSDRRPGWRLWRRWAIRAVLAGLIVAFLTAPVGSAGVCRDPGECLIWQTNIVLIPVPAWLWIVAGVAAFLAVLAVGFFRSRSTPDRS